MSAKPNSHTLYTAKVLARDGWSPDAVQRKTGLPKDAVEQIFLAQSERAQQWGVTHAAVHVAKLHPEKTSL